jgi:hypothetical protein
MVANTESRILKRVGDVPPAPEDGVYEDDQGNQYTVIGGAIQ